MNEIGNRLKERRIELKLSKSELARAAQSSVTMVSKWESGMGMGFDYAARIAEKLDVSLEWLYYGGEIVGEAPTSNRIPIVGNTQAGPNKEWFDLGFPVGFSDEYVDFPARGKHVYALKVIGDSMTPRILEGEAVLVDPESEPATGEEVVVKIKDGDVMVKTLAALRDGIVFLDSYNQGYKRMTFPLKEVEFIHPVVGVARSSRIKLAY
ncbi:TPA: helix-turn-helix transcriptional regulator [Vibrio parahaemolyticus]|nr:helix-turn-helix transcriptional regulator [Vibrio parahaemolyticus]HCE1720350.1 helix-turn-helix transcriptional regulator [Vibrio parahaemolyticus]HCE1730971.1 helix-turn-helix transcriptional regulator [Vibrio parahaemolyticus]HCE2091407.1 helix-turn-helix transcriptional regulator [Vibrio parahaemolyticus]HCE2714292.1 helix-turn-helix transcriptional regulator [Vibrio parahaemolyticus]